MAISVPNTVIETFSATELASHSVSLPTFLENDVVVVAMNHSPNGTAAIGTVTIPSGWTELGTSTATGAASDSRLTLIYRVMQAGDASTVLVTSSTIMTIGAIAVGYRGVDTTTPIDNIVPTMLTGSTNQINSPSTTSVTDNAWILRFGIQDNVDGVFNDSHIPPGTTLRGTMANDPPSNGMALGFADQIQATAGSTGVSNWGSTSVEEWVGATVILRPSTIITPTITDVDGDENIVIGQTNIILTGTNFNATQGTGGLEAADSNVYATATKVSQTIDSWSDTSIQFDFVQGGLSNDSNIYFFVTHDNNQISPAFQVGLGNPPITPTITSVLSNVTNSTTDILPAEDDLELSGNDFGTIQGNGKLELSDNSTYGSGNILPLKVFSWTNTTIGFALSVGEVGLGTKYLYVTENSGQTSIAFSINIEDISDGVTGITTSDASGVHVVTTTQNPSDATLHNVALRVNAEIQPATSGKIRLIDCSISTQSALNYAFTYGGNTDVGKTVEFWDSMVLFGSDGTRRNMRFSRAVRTNFIGNGGTGTRFVYSQVGAYIDRCTFKDFWVHEIAGAPERYAGCSYIGGGLNVLNWEAGTFDIIENNYGVGSTGYDFWIGNGNGGNNGQDFIDCEINMNRLALQNANNSARKWWTITEKLIDIDGDVEGALVIYSDDRASIGGSQVEINRFTSDSNGLITPETFRVLKEQTRMTGGTSSTGITEPSSVQNYTVDTITTTKEIRCYGHLEEPTTFNIESRVGVSSLPGRTSVPQSRFLIKDEGVTLSESAAGALTGISHTTTTMTITENHTIEELYDSRKKYWRDNDNASIAPIRDGLIADFDGVSIIIDGVTLSQGSKYTTIKTSGSFTINTGSVIDVQVIASDVILDDIIHLSNLRIEGNLDFSIAGIYNFSNVTVTGDILNNDATGNVRINASNASSLSTSEPGTTNGQVDIVASVNINVTVLNDLTEAPIENAHVLLARSSDKVLIFSGATNASGTISHVFNYESDLQTVGWAREWNLNGIDFQHKDISGTITNNGLNITVRLTPS